MTFVLLKQSAEGRCGGEAERPADSPLAVNAAQHVACLVSSECRCSDDPTDDGSQSLQPGAPADMLDTLNPPVTHTHAHSQTYTHTIVTAILLIVHVFRMVCVCESLNVAVMWMEISTDQETSCPQTAITGK